MKFRFATCKDSKALLAIYGQYMDTPITFEYVLPSEKAFAGRIEDISAVYPYLVCEEAGRVVGYAYAHQLFERAAYQWDAELSIYLDKSAVSRGLGKRMYKMLMEILTMQGVKTVYGIVTVPNEKSERLHERCGFRRMGTLENTGYKDGWHNVAWFEKSLASCDGKPHPITPVGKLKKEEVDAVLREYEAKP